MEFVERHFRPGLQFKGTRIPIGDLERLETRAVDLGQPGTPPHHWKENDALIVETIVFAMQVVSEP